MSSSTPTIIAGRYELQRRLAQGGMAEVWLAIDLTLDRKVAVKWLKPHLATDPIVAERFRREAIAAASLSHPNIVAVHDVFEQDGRQAVVMQLVEGKSLRQLLDSQNRLSPELTILIGVSVAKALDNAHQAGFVHRDVKPGNIMITPDGRVLLTDFGIAKGLHGDGTDDLTSDNIMMGTAKYLSPEQVRGKRLDGRADLYSLGLVLYECIAGRVPFLGETDADTALARLQRDPTDLSRLRATLPTRLVAVIHALLSRRPEGRPANGAALIVELEAARLEGPPEIDETGAERSPVSPYSAGKLRRAPSDVRGHATDRGRGARQPTPPRGRTARSTDRRRSPDSHPIVRGHATDPQPSGPVNIPGEPAHITGRTPVHSPALVTPSTSVTATGAEAEHRSAPTERHGTPPAGLQRGQPARGMGQTWGPSLIVVGVLIVVAVIIAIVLFLDGRYGADSNEASLTAVDPEVALVEPSVVDAATDPAAPTSIVDEPDETLPATRIVSVSTFDPDGNQQEFDNLTDAVLDGDPSTRWRTECYSNEFMGGKPGVGLVVGFDGTVGSAVSVEVANGPYQLKFFSSPNDVAPGELAAWGEPFDRSFGDDPTVVTADPTGLDARYVLLYFEQLGPNDLCSDTNPFSASIADVGFTP